MTQLFYFIFFNILHFALTQWLISVTFLFITCKNRLSVVKQIKTMKRLAEQKIKSLAEALWTLSVTHRQQKWLEETTVPEVDQEKEFNKPLALLGETFPSSSLLHGFLAPPCRNTCMQVLMTMIREAWITSCCGSSRHTHAGVHTHTHTLTGSWCPHLDKTDNINNEMYYLI